MNARQFFGGGLRRDLTQDGTLVIEESRLQVFNATGGATRSLVLKDARQYRTGPRLVTVVNEGDQAIAVRRSDNTFLGGITSGQAATIGLTDNSTAVGVWTLDVRTVDISAPWNIVHINMDDPGRSEFGQYHPTFDGRTPTVPLNSWPSANHPYPVMAWLDAKAQAGIRFTRARQFARCSPSRAANLTGRYPHVSLAHPHGTQVGNIPQQDGIDADNPLVLGVLGSMNPWPKVLRDAGGDHATLHVGKLHASRHEYIGGQAVETDFAQIVTEVGFDEAYKTELGSQVTGTSTLDTTEPYRGYFAFDAKHVDGDGTVTSLTVDPQHYYLTWELEKIQEWLDTKLSADEGAPFFLNWWTNAPHGIMPAIHSHIGPVDDSTAVTSVTSLAGGVAGESIVQVAAGQAGIWASQGYAAGQWVELTGFSWSGTRKRFLILELAGDNRSMILADDDNEIVQDLGATGAVKQLKPVLQSMDYQDQIPFAAGYTGEIKKSIVRWADYTDVGPGYDEFGVASSPFDPDAVGYEYGPEGAGNVLFRRMRANLEACDTLFGMLEDWLEANYPLAAARTLWIITSDNGVSGQNITPQVDRKWAAVGAQYANVIPPTSDGTVNGDLYHFPDDGKNDVADEGVLVPLIIWSSGLDAAVQGTDCDQLIDATDFYGTFLDLTVPGWRDQLGATEAAKVDGQSFAPAIYNLEHEPRTHSLHMIYKPSPQIEGQLTRIERAVIDQDNWKLIRSYDETVDPVVDTWELYDLDNDPREQTNLYTSSDVTAASKRASLLAKYEELVGNRD